MNEQLPNKQFSHENAPENNSVITSYVKKYQDLINKMGARAAWEAMGEVLNNLEEYHPEIRSTLLFHALVDGSFVQGHPVDYEGKVQEALDTLFTEYEIE